MSRRTYVRKRNVRDVDKEKHITRVSRRYVNIVSIPFVVNATSADTRVTWVFFIVDVTNVRFTQDGTHYSDIWGSIMAAVRYDTYMIPAVLLCYCVTCYVVRTIWIEKASYL